MIYVDPVILTRANKWLTPFFDATTQHAIKEHNFTNEDLQETADVYASEKDYFAMQRWYKKQLKRNPIIQKDNDVTYYRTEKGTVWIGTKN